MLAKPLCFVVALLITGLCAGRSAFAQVSTQFVPGPGGCKSVVIYNNSSHHLQMSVDYLYEANSGGAYKRDTASCGYAQGGSTAPGQSCEVYLGAGPVDCRFPYNVKILATKWTDMTVIWEQERRAAAIQQQREHESEMALARMLDEKNRRESEERARRNEEARRQHEAELAAKRAEEARAIERRRQDPMGLTQGMHGPIPGPTQATTINGSNMTPFEQQVRAEQAERDRLEQYNRQLAVDRASQERHNRDAEQFMQQADRQAKAAQAAAERQRQEQIAAAAAAAERARQEAERQEAQSRAINAAQTELIGASARESEQKLSERRYELMQSRQTYKSEEESLDKMLAMMEAHAGSASRTPDKVLKAQSATLSAEECLRLADSIASAQLPDNAGATEAFESLMFVQKSSIRLIDGGCPLGKPDVDRASARQSLLNGYQDTENDCNAIQSGGRRCIAQNHF